MKRLRLLNNVWVECVNPNITPEEKAILITKVFPPNEEQQTVMNNIQNRSTIPASEEDIIAAQAIYDQNKIEGASLIVADIYLPDGHGMINCRINNDHKQIRF